ncbi:FK506-binding protein 1 [Balamuthia mandrillaris]
MSSQSGVKCIVCGRGSSAAQALQRCAGCKAVHYCNREEQKQHWPDHKSLCKLLAESNEAGFAKRVLKEGDGTSFPKEGAKVTVHYVGTLLDGTEFDSSRRKERPFKFDLGQGQVIRGWDEGVATMSLGERSQLILHPSYGYGSSGVSIIPPNAYLVFDVELLEFSE